MAETPDFQRIARELSALLVDEECDGNGGPSADDIAEQLRLVWNARGAADIMKLEAELSSMMGVTASGPYVKNLDRALRGLDR